VCNKRYHKHHALYIFIKIAILGNVIASLRRFKKIWKNLLCPKFHDHHNNTETLPEAVFLVVCDPSMNEL